jgi:hypothetical protein
VSAFAAPSAFAVEVYRAALLEADRLIASGELEPEELVALMATLERIRVQVYGEGAGRARA